MSKKLLSGEVISFQREKRSSSGEYGTLLRDSETPSMAIMHWPGLNASFGVDVEEAYAEIQHMPAHASPNILECLRNVKLSEDLPFHLEAYPQATMDFPLLEFITGGVTGLGDEQDSTSWIKELDGKYSVFSGVMFEDYKCEIPERGAVKETISGFAGHRAAIGEVPENFTEAVQDTSKPWIWGDIQAIRMGGSPDPTTSIAHCISDISFGFTSEVEKRVHPESTLTTKICGVRVVSRKMFVSLKLTWVDQTFIDIVTGSTKQYLTIVIGSPPYQHIFKFGGLIFPNFSAKAEAKELAGDTITSITDNGTFTRNEGPIRGNLFNIIIADGTSTKTEEITNTHPIGNILLQDIYLNTPQLSTPNKTIKLELLTSDDDVIFSTGNLDASSAKNYVFHKTQRALMGITKIKLTADANVSGNITFSIKIRGMKM